MKQYETLLDALAQLEFCQFADPIGHPLENNIAFIQIKEFATRNHIAMVNIDTPLKTQMFLHEIVSEKSNLNAIKERINTSYKKNTDTIAKKLEALQRLENLAAQHNISIDKVQIAESILSCGGNVAGSVDGRSLAEAAIVDIANDCKHLKKEYFGNKRYEGFYQQCDCSYGMGPRHGGICDRVELKSEARKRELTDEEKDACIYYLNNYAKIQSLKTA